MEPIERELDAHAIPGTRPRIGLRSARLGEAVAAMGAVALVVRPDSVHVRRAGRTKRQDAPRYVKGKRGSVSLRVPGSAVPAGTAGSLSLLSRPAS